MDVELNPHSAHTLSDQWRPTYAEEVAKDQSIELSSEHWQVLAIARAFYGETGISPHMRPLVKLLRTRGIPELASSLELMRLFGDNPATTIAAIAGLPIPVNCLQANP